MRNETRFVLSSSAGNDTEEPQEGLKPEEKKESNAPAIIITGNDHLTYVHHDDDMILCGCVRLINGTKGGGETNVREYLTVLTSGVGFFQKFTQSLTHNLSCRSLSLTQTQVIKHISSYSLSLCLLLFCPSVSVWAHCSACLYVFVLLFFSPCSVCMSLFSDSLSVSVLFLFLCLCQSLCLSLSLCHEVCIVVIFIVFFSCCGRCWSFVTLSVAVRVSLCVPVDLSLQSSPSVCHSVCWLHSA